MKNSIFILLFFSMLSYSQNKEKETVYLFFDLNSSEKCLVDVEGEGYKKLNRYRKENQNHLVFFSICGEEFTFNKKRETTHKHTINSLHDIKFVDLQYLNKKKSENVMRYNPFEKIYLIEKISSTEFIMREVTWIDNWNMIRN